MVRRDTSRTSPARAPRRRLTGLALDEALEREAEADVGAADAEHDAALGAAARRRLGTAAARLSAAERRQLEHTP
eukprot:gene34333-58530_t